MRPSLGRVLGPFATACLLAGLRVDYAYSGGVRYSRSVSLSPEDITRKVELNPGAIVASAEVWVKGKNAMVRIAPPWVYSISEFVRADDTSKEAIR
jgi:hypothetical protein